uniref:Glycolipid transfer protein domain-containing protein n=1 Tax=Haptolina brevifila TaxID=156173 RepID=A0A7S2G5G7_9EUKA|mmetsp:Transcript_26403/g.53041  ORF Transcript_26403/g.53041 Transcript_26403/m.53041 type:complete len:214 (+) Transcript_26403:78-719(+)|eukprot:CAMPEP_0174725090 /NCGR_PEP_ID=MMETSP1094-20130205/44775_1 /TAXON_ID=156173 /ORGANISM="Chrysochromulina brevifilum, Strain UTEX LB 985" /LENGTH=213 /DNA_ID=CAMNT_0015926417 /DNA_START=78 /DNA_END=719 /DNA_ORIENTATION=-
MASQLTWLQDLLKRLESVEREDGKITIKSYVHVAEGNQAVYPIIFNGYLTTSIGTQLAQSNKDGCATVLKDAEEMGKTTVLALVSAQVAKLGEEECGKPGNRNATKSILWLCRELNFICQLLRLIASGKKSSDAGYEAYDLAIKQYHPWILQQAVGTAVGYVPAIEDIVKALGIPSVEEGKRQVDAFVPAMEAFVKETMDILIQEKANFQGYA